MKPRGAKILYTSGAVRSALTALFSNPHRRRVAIAAFVGGGAGAFLPNPKGIELICWPQAGGTNPSAIRELMAAGVQVKFADTLHMKVYWAEGKGVIITSANLSTNALGAGNLHEVGVLLPAEKVDIDRIIATVRPRLVTGMELNRLDKAHKKFHTGKSRLPERSRALSFREWYSSPHSSKWKLFAWTRNYEISRSAKQMSAKTYGVRVPEGSVMCARGECTENDWILCFRTNDRRVWQTEWQYVDFVIKVPKSDKRSYDRKFPYEAVQVKTAKHYPAPPFAVTSEFRRSFNIAAKAFGLSKFSDRGVRRPPAILLENIDRKTKA